MLVAEVIADMSVDTKLDLVAGLQCLAELSAAINLIDVVKVVCSRVVFRDDAQINIILINAPASLSNN